MNVIMKDILGLHATLRYCSGNSKIFDHRPLWSFLFMTKFVIEPYDKYFAADRQHSRYIFYLHDYAYAIKEYEYKHGYLMRPVRVEESETIYQNIHMYDTYEEAFEYVQLIKKLNL